MNKHELSEEADNILERLSAEIIISDPKSFKVGILHGYNLGRAERYLLPSEMGLVFANYSDCYADNDECKPIMAITEERFNEIVEHEFMTTFRDKDDAIAEALSIIDEKEAENERLREQIQELLTQIKP